jgi:hypothetical protein
VTTALATTTGAALTGRSLPELEQMIEAGLEMAGAAYREIRDNRRYREAGYSDFDVYCRERWNRSRRRIDQLIEAGGVVTELRRNPSHSVLPKNAEQAAALAPVRDDPEVLNTVWEEVVETAPSGNVTGAHVAEVVERYVEPEPEPEPEPDAGEPDAPVALGPDDLRFDDTKALLQRAVVKLGRVSQALSAHVDSLDFSTSELRELRAVVEKLGERADKGEALVEAVRERRTQRDGQPMPRRPATDRRADASVDERFHRFHREHPEVFAHLREQALARARAEDGRFSVRVLTEQMRIEGRGFNNNFSARYARLLEEAEPELRGRLTVRGASA